MTGGRPSRRSIGGTDAVDHFVGVALAKAGLKPAIPADRQTLIRRLSLVLTGLPPTPLEVDLFVRDTSVEAYPRLVDRLLASPHFGERWARHWMDVMRFAKAHRHSLLPRRDGVHRRQRARVPQPATIRTGNPRRSTIPTPTPTNTSRSHGVHGLREGRLPRPQPVHAPHQVLQARGPPRDERDLRDDHGPPSDPRPGPQVVNCDNAGTCVPAVVCDDDGNNCLPFRYPWVYMGPGIWIDPEFSPANPRKVHIRLSHTHNDIPGLADYTGEVDPRKRPARDLAQVDDDASRAGIEPPAVRASHHPIRRRGHGSPPERHGRRVRSRPPPDLELRRGHGQRRSHHVQPLRVQRRHAHLVLPQRPQGRVRPFSKRRAVRNNLGKQTLRSLDHRRQRGRRQHDPQLRIPQRPRPVPRRDQHRLPSQLDQQPERRRPLPRRQPVGRTCGSTKTSFTKTLSPISFAGGKVAGPFYIYRNLVDVRAPTAGVSTAASWRPGRLALRQHLQEQRRGRALRAFPEHVPGLRAGRPSLVSALPQHWAGQNPRRSFNNIFLAVNPDADSDRTITFLPSPSFPGPTDGNLYHRVGRRRARSFGISATASKAAIPSAGTFDCLAGWPASLHGSPFFHAESRASTRRATRRSGIEADPQFLSIGGGRPLPGVGRPAASSHESGPGRGHRPARRPAGAG